MKIKDERPRKSAFSNHQSGRDAFTSIHAQASNTKAIVCFNDIFAYHAIEAIFQHGLTPKKDIKVIGFDDLEVARVMFPSLSSVNISADEIGRRTCQTHSELLSHSTPALRTLVDVTLQSRDSSQ